MGNDNYILSIDYGTQSVKVSVFDDKGNILAFEKQNYNPPYFSANPSWFEQHADFYWEQMCLASQKLCQKNFELMNNVKGVVTSCFRDTAVMLDKNHKPIRPAILWLDQRVAKVEEKLPLLNRTLFALVGMKETVRVQRAKSMSNWLKVNEPINWKQTDKYVNISTYLNYRMIGELKDSPSNYAGHYPLDFKRCKWYGSHALKFPVFNIDASKLCELVDQNLPLGKVSLQAHEESGIPFGIPLLSSSSDKANETIGNGSIDETSATISYGTAATISISSKRYVEPETFLPAYATPIKNLYNTEVQIYRGYWMINWFVEQFYQSEKEECEKLGISYLDKLNKEMFQLVPGADGLILDPYWGPSLKRPNYKGVVIGFSDNHTKIHLYRAIIEGICFSLKNSLTKIERKMHRKVERLYISGGGAVSDEIAQITADIFNLPVYRVQTIETSSLGSAIVGFVKLGIYDSLETAIIKMVRTKSKFLPRHEISITYDYIFKNIYQKIYKNNIKICKNIRKLTKIDI